MKKSTSIFIIFIMAFSLLSYKGFSKTEFSKPFNVSDVTANFIYKIIKYVKWKNKSNKTNICTISGRDIGDALERIKNSSGAKLRITIRNDVKSYNNCDILYIGTNKKLSSIINATKGKFILTVSDIKNFAKKGGAVGFVYDSKSVEMEVNLKAVRDSGLAIDSKLLKLMTVVD